jgi:hypothetical protein
VNGNIPTVTDRGDVRGRMRVVKTPPPAPIPGAVREESAHARAIPPRASDHQGSKVRDFVLLHGGEMREAAATGWGLNESPPPLATSARQVLPGKGEYRNPIVWVARVAAGVFRLGVHTVAWLAALSVNTDKRAGAGLALFLLLLAIYLVAHIAVG